MDTEDLRRLSTTIGAMATEKQKLKVRHSSPSSPSNLKVPPPPLPPSNLILRRRKAKFWGMWARLPNERTWIPMTTIWELTLMILCDHTPYRSNQYGKFACILISLISLTVNSESGSSLVRTPLIRTPLK